jgi:hypothetical protein
MEGDGNDAPPDATADASLDAPGASDGGDAPVPSVDGGEAGVTSLAGTWRLVRLETRTAENRPLTLTDSNTTVSSPGGSYFARANGMLFLSDTRLSLTSAILVNDHLGVDQNATTDESVSAYGIAVPGSLAQQSFSIPGAPSILFVRNADGTITQQPGTANDARMTWARVDGLVASGAVGGLGVAVRVSPGGVFEPGTALRVTLAWDLPGSAGVTLTHDAPLTFLPHGYAAFEVAVNAPPAEALAEFGAVRAAVAHVLVYDDTDGNGQFDPATDVLRGRSPIVIAFRSPGTPSSALRTSPLRDLLPGMQFAHLHSDYTVPGGLGLTPFDPTHPIAPDVPVQPGVLSAPLPDLL